jgi:transposase
MRIVGGLDVHRRQITFDYLDERSGRTRRGRIAPADRLLLRRWLETTLGETPAAFAVEARTGRRFVVEERQRAGIEAHLAEPAETAAARGPKRRAKTDRTDARHLRELLAAGRLPESWIPPEHVLEMRARRQLFQDLREEHTARVQRIHAILLHQGAPAIAGDLLGADNRRRLEVANELSPAGRQAVATALRILDALDAERVPLRKQIAAFAHRRPGCRALQAHSGVGEITAVALWAEPGDTRRFSASRKGGAAHRARHHRLLLRRQTPTRASIAAGLTAAAPGAGRGRPVRRPPRLPGSRLLPAGRRAARRQPGRAFGGAQDRPPGAPHPARARRRGAHPGLTLGPGARICPPTDARGPLLPAPLPAAFSPRPASTDRAAASCRDTPSIIMSPQPQRSARLRAPRQGRAPAHPTPIPAPTGHRAGPGAAHDLNP